MKTEEICEDRQVLERRKEDIKIRAGESEKDIAHEDEPEIMEEHEEELPPPQNCHHHGEGRDIITEARKKTRNCARKDTKSKKSNKKTQAL